MAGPDFIEIGTDDPASTTAFFKAMVGWEWTKNDEGAGGYLTDGTRKVVMYHEGTPCMVPYLNVVNIEGAVTKVRAEGSALMGDIADAPGFGGFVTCTNPRGVRFGLHQN